MSEAVEPVPFAPNVIGNNTRVAKIRRFTARPPKNAASLMLVGAMDDGEAQIPLGQWEKDEVTTDTALMIEQALNDYAIEMGGHVTASLGWIAENNRVLISLPLKRQANHVLDEANETVQGLNAQLTGDQRSLVQQAQVASERVQKIYIAGIASILVHSERIVQRQAEMLGTLANRLGRAEARADAKEAELEALRDAIIEAREQGGEQPNPALDRAVRILEGIAPHIAAQLFANARPAQPAQTATVEE